VASALERLGRTGSTGPGPAGTRPTDAGPTCRRRCAGPGPDPGAGEELAGADPDPDADVDPDPDLGQDPELEEPGLT
jgi:hypothetical protein